jgi:hypothetical protein
MFITMPFRPEFHEASTAYRKEFIGQTSAGMDEAMLS